MSASAQCRHPHGRECREPVRHAPPERPRVSSWRLDGRTSRAASDTAARPRPLVLVPQLPSGQTTVPDPGAPHRREHRHTAAARRADRRAARPVRDGRARHEFEIRHVDGADRGAAARLEDADAILIRSATRWTPRRWPPRRCSRWWPGPASAWTTSTYRRPPPAACWWSTPQSNIVTAAEHALALLLAVARKIPAADASVRAGEWKRSKFTGVEIADKTVGVVGSAGSGSCSRPGGRVRHHRHRLRPLPAAGPGRRARRPAGRPADAAGDAPTSSRSTCRDPGNARLIGAAELATVKPGVLIVNAARGGLIDEQALADA